MDQSERVREMALEAGFDLVGCAPLRPPADAHRFADWLRAGRHGQMHWLEAHRARILDPRRLLPQGKSLLVLGLGHARAAGRLVGGGRVARYALGRDYHNLIGRRLRRLALRLRGERLVGEWRKVVDAGPLLERSHAAEAGVGFSSKAANLLHPRHGPWFFLAELLLDRDLGSSSAPPVGSCGSCRACLDACPTQAILEPGLVDARLCLSYHTIESPALMPRELRVRAGEWVFGCDVCSEVCPWGWKAPDAGALMGSHAEIERGSLPRWLTQSEEQFRVRFEGSGLQRPGRAGLARNAAIALGNTPSDSGVAPLEYALEHDTDASVRAAAAWALAQAHGHEPRVRALLERALAAADGEQQRAELCASLEATRREL